MANRLAMAQIKAILRLHKTRKSNRKIADLLGMDRGTVGKYVRRAEALLLVTQELGTGEEKEEVSQGVPLALLWDFGRD